MKFRIELCSDSPDSWSYFFSERHCERKGFMMHRLLIAFLLLTSGVARAADRPPNIVFVFADDLGINDLSCYGRKDQQTPNLDRLAAQGTRFTSAYCAQPICSPSRAAVMTGKTPARLHLTTFLPGRADCVSQKLLHPQIAMQLPLEEVTIAESLKAAGYATACVGKWHLGGQGFGPKEQGFDFVHVGKANTSPSATEGGKGEYDLTAAAEKFIADNQERPFFLYMPHNNPHVPIAAKAELVEKYKNSFNPIYAAMIETLDDSVGRLMAKLDELKLVGNTIFIFTSDNGGLHVQELPNTPATHNTPFRAGKGYVYEGGLRIPLIVRWPSVVKAGRVVDSPVINTDFVPTLLELAGVTSDVAYDGASIAALLKGGDAQPRPFFWHFPHYTNQGGRPAGAIREGNWKLIAHYDTGRVELFDLSKDIGEQHDIAAEHVRRVSELHDKLKVWRKGIDAQENTPNPDFDPVWFQKLYIDVDPSLIPLKPTAVEMSKSFAAWREGMNSVLPKARK